MPHYPISIDLTGRRCVVIGGGSVAERKVETLLEFGARTAVVAPRFTKRLLGMESEGLVELVRGTYEPSALQGAFLVIAATDDREVNKAVSEDAQRAGILVNVVDDPELCTFFVPASVRRGDLIVSVSSSARSPFLARRVKKLLESVVGPEYGDLAELMGWVREEVKATYGDQAERARAYERVLDSDVLELLRQGRRKEAAARARECILQSSD
jgi:precorrin-2 dehydrogenase/sirohydrochlorin ferrochelatase